MKREKKIGIVTVAGGGGGWTLVYYIEYSFGLRMVVFHIVSLHFVVIQHKKRPQDNDEIFFFYNLFLYR